MSTPEAEKNRLLQRLKEAEEQAQSLNRLKEQIRDAIGQVESVISGTSSGRDRQVLQRLNLNVERLEDLVRTMQDAVREGRSFANTLF